MDNKNLRWGKWPKLFMIVEEGTFIVRKKLTKKTVPIKFEIKNVEVDTRRIQKRDVTRNYNLRNLSNDELSSLLNDISSRILNGESLDSQRDLVVKEIEYRSKIEAIETADLKTAIVSFQLKTYILHDKTTVSDAKLDDLINGYNSELSRTDIDDSQKDIIRVCLDKVNDEKNFRAQKALIESAYPAKDVNYTESIDEPIKRVEKRLQGKYGLKGLTIILPWQRVMKVSPTKFAIDTQPLEIRALNEDNIIENYVVDFDFQVSINNPVLVAKKFVNNGINNVEEYINSKLGPELDTIMRAYLQSGGINKILGVSNFDVKELILSDSSLYDKITKKCDEYGVILENILIHGDIQRSSDKAVEKNAQLQAIINVARQNGMEITINDAAKIMSGNYNVAELNAGQMSNILGRQVVQNQTNPTDQNNNNNSAPTNNADLENFINNGYVHFKRANSGASDELIAQQIAAEIVVQKSKFNLDYQPAYILVCGKLGINPITNNNQNNNNNSNNNNNNDNTNNNQNNNSDPALDNFIQMGYELYKNATPGLTDEEYAEKIAEQIKNRFGMESAEALTLVKNKLGIVDPTNSIISVADVENARTYLISNGISEDSITNDNLAQVIVYFNPSLDEAAVLAELRNMSAPNAAINAAVEQIQNEGGVFVLNENLFADRLVNILASQGITMDKETAKGYFASLNNSGPTL